MQVEPNTPDPLDLLPDQDFVPTARRELEVHGVPVELLWLPERAQRAGVPQQDSPAFRPNRAPQILAAETLWRDQGLSLTPNRFPFARHQGVLWEEKPRREPSLEMLQTAFELAERRNGTALLNSIGAAASIPRAHLHLIDETRDSLDRIPTAPLTKEWCPEVDGLECAASLKPWPLLVVLRGSPTERAKGAFALLEQRSTPAFNLVAAKGETWIAPRSPIEIPSPYFPHALGSAEVWGRWCFAEEEAFAKASGQDLEEALSLSLLPAHRQ